MTPERVTDSVKQYVTCKILAYGPSTCDASILYLEAVCHGNPSPFTNATLLIEEIMLVKQTGENLCVVSSC